MHLPNFLNKLRPHHKDSKSDAPTAAAPAPAPAMSPKPVLYTFGLSVWSAVVELAALELGVEIESKIINVVAGENFSPEFLKINPAGTIPAIVAPDGKVYGNTVESLRYILSVAPKKVTPGHAEIIDKVHDDDHDPNFALLTARNEEELKKAAEGFPFTFVTNRQNALEKYSSSAEGAAFKDWYAEKLQKNGGLLKVYKGEVPATDFFAISTKLWENLTSYILHDLPQILPESGFIAGAEPGEDDYHVAAWLARVTWVTGGNKELDGYKALEKELHTDVPPKVVAYWQLWASRPSWSKVYAETLH